MTGRPAGAGLVLGVLLLLASARPALVTGQVQVIPGGSPSLTTPDLHPDHWAIGAARRAEALGLLSRPLPFRRGIPVELAGQALREARQQAVGRGESLERLTRGWEERYLREFGGLATEVAVDGPRPISARAGVRGLDQQGGDAPGFGEVAPDRTGAFPLADVREGTLEGEAVGAWRRLGVLVQPEVGSNWWEIRRADVVVGAGAWTLALGRQPVGYGQTRPGGIVLNGGATLDRIELRTERPAELGGRLAVLGPSALQLFISRLDDPRHAREPYLWGGSVSIQPFPRFGVAVHRAAMFGGHGYDEPLTLKTVVDMLIGRVRGLGFENQIVSVEGRFRLPTEGVLPLTAYLEWGAEDAAGGWWDVPARVIGLETPAVPGLEAMLLGGAYTRIEAHCCGNSPWYRHGAFAGNWAAAGEPLGHPLGGEGSEWLAYATLDRPERGLSVDAELFRRDRRGQNLYVPGRERSAGGELRALWRGRKGRIGVEGGVGFEKGSGWREHRLEAEANVFF